jgi:hypothetical protein
LIKLSRAFPTPRTSRGGVDLTDRDKFADRMREDGRAQSPYDRMMEIVSKPPNGMPSLRERLEALTKTAAWQNATGDSQWAPGGMKYQLALREVQKYQTYAYRQMLAEYPSVREELKRQNLLSRAAKAGGDSAVERMESLFAAPEYKQ